MALVQRKEAEPKGFLAISLKRFHKAKGDVIVPTEEGYFVPKDQEELDILTHHMAAGRVEFDSGETPVAAE